LFDIQAFTDKTDEGINIMKLVELQIYQYDKTQKSRNPNLYKESTTVSTLS